ncbi:MAG: hypothetical protein PHY92_00785 [Alphaproteobacteria bacterium]|nr:hypothetical protein [Alphaproteobacteria bacterium]
MGIQARKKRETRQLRENGVYFDLQNNLVVPIELSPFNNTILQSINKCFGGGMVIVCGTKKYSLVPEDLLSTGATLGNVYYRMKTGREEWETEISPITSKGTTVETVLADMSAQFEYCVRGGHVIGFLGGRNGNGEREYIVLDEGNNSWRFMPVESFPWLNISSPQRPEHTVSPAGGAADKQTLPEHCQL